MLVVNHLFSHSDDTFHTLFALLLEMKMFSCRGQAYFTVTCRFLFTEKPDLCQRTVACSQQLCLRVCVRPQPDLRTDWWWILCSLTMLVLSESAWGDPSASPCSATYRTLGFNLDAMETGSGGHQTKEGLTPTSFIPNQDWKKMEDFYYRSISLKNTTSCTRAHTQLFM